MGVNVYVSSISGRSIGPDRVVPSIQKDSSGLTCINGRGHTGKEGTRPACRIGGKRGEHQPVPRLRRIPRRGTVSTVGQLIGLIQAHLDKYGVTRSEFARRAGTTPQTVQNWWDKPTTFPRPEHLKGVAEVIGVPYLLVLEAALVDAGYRELTADEAEEDAPPPSLNDPEPRPAVDDVADIFRRDFDAHSRRHRGQ